MECGITLILLMSQSTFDEKTSTVQYPQRGEAARFIGKMEKVKEATHATCNRRYSERRS